MYQAQDFRGLIGLSGFSEALLTNHFALYEGYVKNVNLLEEKLDALRAADQLATPEYAELKRRFGWEWNGMRLHEYYFANLTKEQKHTEGSDLHQIVVKQFGSAEAWEKDFRATGAMRGIGWVVLVYDFASKRLENTWINEHDGGHLAGCVPLLVMDVFEHAFVLDYGTKRAEYIEAFFKSIDWELVSKRFDGAVAMEK
ncbi:MAG: Fe-Mn family superoxide dismutase [Candidatus Moraniibacteriota bacterium]